MKNSIPKIVSYGAVRGGEGEIGSASLIPTFHGSWSPMVSIGGRFAKDTPVRRLHVMDAAKKSMLFDVHEGQVLLLSSVALKSPLRIRSEDANGKVLARTREYFYTPPWPFH